MVVIPHTLAYRQRTFFLLLFLLFVLCSDLRLHFHYTFPTVHCHNCILLLWCSPRCTTAALLCCRVAHLHRCIYYTNSPLHCCKDTPLHRCTVISRSLAQKQTFTPVKFSKDVIIFTCCHLSSLDSHQRRCD